jgi:steroid delta-isomerase-like uncharacterized protein
MQDNGNKAIVRSFIEAWNRRDMAAMSQFWAPNVVHHARFTDHDLRGIQRIYGNFMEAFPDLHFSIEIMIAEGSTVVTRMKAHATHKGEFLGKAPTDKSISCTLIDIARLADDKIVEHWGLTDELHLLEQIDLVPIEYLSAMS